MNPAPTLRPLNRDRFDLVAHLRVNPGQVRYSGTVRDAFDEDEDEDGVGFHAIVLGKRAVGFFKIDRNYPARYPFANKGDLGLRAFLVDKDQQGRGIATAAVAAFPAYLPTHYPDAPSLVLSVNRANPAAIACYLNGGFCDTGEIYLQGSAGPQQVLRMALTAR